MYVNANNNNKKLSFLELIAVTEEDFTAEGRMLAVREYYLW